MVKKLEIFLYSLLSRHLFTSDSKKHLLLISYAACVYATIMHLFLFFFYLAVGVLPLFFVSMFGLLIDVLLFWLVDKSRYFLFGILLSVTVIVHTMAAAVCIGSDSFIILYLLVTLMMQVIIPYASARVRVLMGAALWVCMIALIFISHHVEPSWDIGIANVTLTVFNVQLAFFGTAIQLTIGNIIWDTIARFNRMELRKARSEANTDPLTGLLNRRYADTFFEKLSTSQSEQTWCVAMLDIDDFKLVNDINGHRIGDGVLVSVSNIIKTNLRKTDVVFRWGGEEFLLLLKDVDVSAAFHTLNKLRGAIAAENLEIHDTFLKVTVTIGICPLDIRNVEKSIETSDRLMYKGKMRGKNTVVM
ncbi:MAG: diguanylate cyclase [Clostridiaceae bacterium]|nr:diguanylate cyclase [Clostridiaceae bacterium]